MKKNIVYLLILVFIIGFFSCSITKLKDDVKPNKTPQKAIIKDKT